MISVRARAGRSCYNPAMSPALQKLRKDLDVVKGRYFKQASSAVVAGPKGPVEWDVVEMLYTAVAALDVEIRKLKGEKAVSGEHTVAASAPMDTAAPAANADAYVGHIDVPEHPPIYSMKKPKASPPQEPGE